MNYSEFIKIVKSRSGITDDLEAERAVCATLLTIAEHMPEENAERLSGELPEEFSGCFRNALYGQYFDIKDFYTLVSERENVDPQTAVAHARAVFDVLVRAVSEEELEELLDEFSPDYEDLFGMTLR